MTCLPVRHGLSGCDAGRPAHSEAESSSTCYEHTFMWSTCQDWGESHPLRTERARMGQPATAPSRLPLFRLFKTGQHQLFDGPGGAEPKLTESFHSFWKI